MTSDEHGSSLGLSKKFLPVCNKQCRKDLPFLVLQNILFIAGLWASISFYRKENDISRKKFIFSALLWLGLMFIISIPIIYKMSPYYYLVAVPPLFVLLGTIFEKMKVLSKRYGTIIFILLACVFVFFGVKNDLTYLREHEALGKNDVENMLGREIYDDRKITLEQLEKATDYIKEHKSSDVPVRIAADNTFARAIFYLLQYQNDIPSCYVKTSSFHPSGKLDYFIVYRRSVNEDIPTELYEKFSISGQEEFGNLMIIDARAKKIDTEQTADADACFTF
jgi:hypothetical protein